MDTRLQTAIGTPKIQGQADELVTLALGALDDLKRLDEGIYERFVASRDRPQDPTAGAVSLQRLWDTTFGGLLKLLLFCRTLESEVKTEPIAVDSLNLDFGDLEGGGSASAGLDLGAADIGDLLEGIEETAVEGDAEKWSKVVEKVGSIEYGLRTQQTDAIHRFNVALSAGETNQVLAILDDTQSAASEGVHALVAAVYEAFLPDINAATVVPGYMTSLGRALLVRRGIAELAAQLEPLNAVLQSDQAARHAPSLAKVRESLHAFVNSVVCRAMRPADRWQMVEFLRDLASQTPAAARLTSEGLVKYLDSLGSINQREVLVLHDQRTIEVMREALATARGLVDISPRTANEMLDRAYQAAQRLRGRRVATDQLLIQLERFAPTSSNPAESVQFLERLEAVLASS